MYIVSFLLLVIAIDGRSECCTVQGETVQRRCSEGEKQPDMSSTEAILLDEYDYEGLPDSTPLAANLIAGTFAGVNPTLLRPTIPAF